MQILKWDSDFFGFKVGILGEMDIKASIFHENLKKIAESDVELIYIYSDRKLTENEIQNSYFNTFLADEKTTFIKREIPLLALNNAPIYFYQENFVDKNLYNLALQSGHYSRFKVDSRMPQNTYVRLYNTWIEASVNKKIASEVLVYKQDDNIVGLLTLGKKNGRGDIGLFAVDTHCRGQGIGKKLMRTAENWFYQMGLNSVQVVTQLNNLEACAFYKSCGFEIEKIEFIYHFWKK